MLRCQQEGVYISALDRQTGSYVINPVGNGGFSSKARCDIAKLKREETCDNDDDNANNERSYPKQERQTGGKWTVTSRHMSHETLYSNSTVCEVKHRLDSVCGHSSDRLTASL